MKTAVAIFFLVLLVSIQTPVGQLFKLPKLIEHFVKHKNQNGESFMSFLQDHYAPGHNDSDLPEDDQLPFKNIAFYSISNAIVPGVIKADVFIRLSGDKKLVAPDVYTPQQHLTSIFHPPRG